MLDQIFNLLAQDPSLSILLLFVLVAVLGGISIIVYKDTFALWLRKVLKAYNDAEVHDAVVKAQEVDRNNNVEADTETLAILVVDQLKHKLKDKSKVKGKNKPESK